MGGYWSVDAEFRIPGIVIELCQCDWLSAVEFADTSPYHNLSLSLSQLSDLAECAIPHPEAGDLSRVGYLSFWPAGIPYRRRGGAGHHRFLRFLLEPAHFEAVTQLGHGWAPNAGMDIRGTAIDAAMLRIAYEVAAPGYGTATLIQGLTTTIMADLARFLRGTTTREAAGRLSASQLHRIEVFVENHEGSTPRVGALAELLGVSQRNLTRLFKQSTGQTIHDYIAHVRVRKAGALLCGTDLRLKEISRRVGFSGLASFSAAFHAATGQTPTAFRRQLRDGSPTVVTPS